MNSAFCSAGFLKSRYIRFDCFSNIRFRNIPEILQSDRRIYSSILKADYYQWTNILNIKIFVKDINLKVLLQTNCGTIHAQSIKLYSDKKGNELMENQSHRNNAVSTSVVENIKETTKTVTYTGVVVFGFSIAIAIIYTIFSELFFSKSPHRIYSKSFDYVANDTRVRNIIGDKIKGFGEETRRGRRQHVSHVEYTKEGKKYLRMKFHIKGSRAVGSVHLEMIENDEGKYDYRYLFVIIEGLHKETIILEDNRHKFEKASGSPNAIPLTSAAEIDGENYKELDLSLK